MSSKHTAVITGTSTGFGYLAAIAVAEAGYHVYATMRDTAGRNAKPRQELEAKGITVVEVDVTNQASVDALEQRVLAEAGRVDVLINNAGTAHMGVTEAFTPESAERQFATNVIGPVRLNRAFLPTMRAQKSGLVIFISSVVGRFVLPFTGIYAGSKFAIEALAESMSYELRPFAVDVAIVEPGAYATNIFNVLITPDDTDRVASYGDTAHIFDLLGQKMGETAGDPRGLVEGIVNLIKLAPGTRPLRTTLPADSPASAINAAIEPIQEQIIEGMGLNELAAKKPLSIA